MSVTNLILCGSRSVVPPKVSYTFDLVDSAGNVVPDGGSVNAGADRRFAFTYRVTGTDGSTSTTLDETPTVMPAPETVTTSGFSGINTGGSTVLYGVSDVVYQGVKLNNRTVSVVTTKIAYTLNVYANGGLVSDGGSIQLEGDGNADLSFEYRLTGSDGSTVSVLDNPATVNIATSVNTTSGCTVTLGTGTHVVTLSGLRYDGQEFPSVTVNVIVTAKTKPVTSVTLDRSGTLDQQIGDSLTLNATVRPNDADDKSLDWESSNTSVARVSGNGTRGQISCRAAGLTTITVRSVSNPSASDSVDVEVAEATIDVTSVVLDQSGTLSQNVGDSLTLYPTVYPDDATDKSLTWRSSNTSVARVSGNDYSGTVSCRAAGTATITVRSVANSSAYDTVRVSVAEPEPTVTYYATLEPEDSATGVGSQAQVKDGDTVKVHANSVKVNWKWRIEEVHDGKWYESHERATLDESPLKWGTAGYNHVSTTGVAFKSYGTSADNGTLRLGNLKYNGYTMPEVNLTVTYV